MSTSTVQQKRLFDILSLKHKRFKNAFARKHTHALSYLAGKGLALEQLRQHSAKMLAGGVLGSALVLSSPVFSVVPSIQPKHTYQYIQQFALFLHQFPQNPIQDEDKKTVEENIASFFAVETRFVLENHELPTYRGFMGLEQHLFRSATDTLDQHGAFEEEGIAPARGAFGYFYEPHDSILDIEDKERYYIVLQTFLISNWNSDWATLKKWYKFRKFLVINPETGKAVVAVLGDSGPATWTGKQFGGSPEVMYSLGFYPKRTKGEVVVLFVDDPENVIPLGPLAPKR